MKAIFEDLFFVYRSFNLCNSNSVFPVPAKPWMVILFWADGWEYINLLWSPSNRIIFFLTWSNIVDGFSPPIRPISFILPMSNDNKKSAWRCWDGLFRLDFFKISLTQEISETCIYVVRVLFQALGRPNCSRYSNFSDKYPKSSIKSSQNSSNKSWSSPKLTKHIFRFGIKTTTASSNSYWDDASIPNGALIT